MAARKRMTVRRAVRILGFAVPIGAGALLAASPGQAIQLLGSSATANAYASSELCASYSAGAGSVYACNHNVTGRVFVEDQETTDTTDEVSVSGSGAAYQYVYSTSQGPAFIDIPGSPLAVEARARTLPFANHASARTVAFSSVTGGEDITGAGNETRYNSSDASAEASSVWAEEITFLGAQTLGQGAMRFSIHGTISGSSYGDPIFTPEGPEGASIAFQPGENASWNEMVFAVDVLDGNEEFVTGAVYRAYSDGTVDADLTVLIPFTYGETYTLVGSLSVNSKGYGLNHLSCEITPGGGQSCSVLGASGQQSTLDFDSTVTVESLTVPEGTTVLGTNGAALPFPVVVPEPGTALLVGGGLAALARRRGAGRAA